ncbi:hypothetical protein MU1_12590 [Paenibacillus glycanilyticus]|uniref:histidine kinase n=2 Tax=Paenibacillus glycanilyticus TaxID=126569 RepID=A0ABQ6G8T2_9BACL|nr:hypothetical protein MU1_12590 [Paenibacillus glycanilyticus]
MITAVFALWMVQNLLTTTEDNQLTTLSGQYKSELQKLLDSPKGDVLFDSYENSQKGFVPSGLQLNQMAWLVDPKGQIIFESPSANKLGLNDEAVDEVFPMSALLPSVLERPAHGYHNIRANGRTFRIGGLVITSGELNEYRVIVAQEITNDAALLAQLRWAFAGLALVLLAAGGVAGYLLAGRAMKPIANAFQRQEQFTSDASHELRTPLSILKSAYEVLDEQSDRLPEFHRNVLKKSGREIHHMSRLVENLLTLARSDNGRIELAVSRFSLWYTINQVIEQLQPIAASKDVSLEWEVNQEGNRQKDSMIQADEVRIRQLILILVENAIQYNREGGRVTVALDVSLQTMSFSVMDTGIGIEHADLPHIFERFYRIDKARTRRSEGTGLGLAIAKQIVDAHQAKIEVWTEPRAGTTFRVTLPSIS